MSILLFDRDSALTRYISRAWTVFQVRSGILTPLQRIRSSNVDAALYYFHPNKEYERLAACMMEVTPARHLVEESKLFDFLDGKSDEVISLFDFLIDSNDLTANKLIDGVGGQIVDDLKWLDVDAFDMNFTARAGVYVEGRLQDVYVHKAAKIGAGTVLDSRNGPIVIDSHVEISRLSYVAGPAYIGPYAKVDNCQIVGAVSIGRQCRVGGEIEASIIGDFSNKHHEGFLGHSLVGRWVNIGALTTTSDLKNNYGDVKVNVPAEFLSAPKAELRKVSTNSIKFGSVISDCVKLAIGQKLSTGSVIDFGSNVFGESVPKYVPRFSWGLNGSTYDIDRFLSDCERIFARRQQSPSSSFVDLVRFIGECVE